MWTYFKPEEFQCSHCGENHISTHLVDTLDKMRAEAGFPFVITSGYRCPEYNDQISSTGTTGPHTTGLAVDIQCSHKQANKILELAYKYNFKGKGISQKGDINSRFIHLDMLDEAPGRPRPHVWSY